MREDRAASPFIAYAGFVTTPRYFDHSPQEFLRVAPMGVGVVQRVMHVPDYGFALEERAANFDQLEESAVCLAEAGCQVVGQVGTNWVHCSGTTPEDIRALCQTIGEKSGARFLMAGLCIVDALRALGARRIAVANGYFRDDWRDGINRFLAQAGFEILWSGNLIDQGLYRSVAELEEIERRTRWCYPARDIVQAVHRAHLAAPDADAVVQTGAGFRTVSHIEAIEGLIGKPLVPSDVALYWAMLEQLALDAPVRGVGRLMQTLA